MKILGMVVTLVILSSLLAGLISCTSEEPTTQPTSTVTPTGTATSTPTEVKPIVLKFADNRPWTPGYFGTLPEMIPWKTAVETVTDGRILIDEYPSESLLKSAMLEIGVSQGIADIATGTRVDRSVLPLNDVMQMPPQHDEHSAVQNQMIFWFIMYKYLEKDYDATNLIDIGPDSLAGYYLITLKKPIRTLAEVKGLTLGEDGKQEIELFSAAGAIIIPIIWIDMSEAFAKGMCEAGIWNWEGPFLFGWTEHMDPGYFIDVGGIKRSLLTHGVMNKTKHDSLPADLQEILDELSFRWLTMEFVQRIDLSDELFKAEAAKKGIQYIEWSPEEKEKLNVLKEKLLDDWIQEMEDKYGRGDEAAELLQIYNNVVDKYVPPAPVPMQPEVGGDQAEWDAVYGPGSTWGMGYKAYPNQIGLHELEGDEFKAW